MPTSMDIPNSVLCRALLFGGIILYFTVLFLANRCPNYCPTTDDGVVSPVLKPASNADYTNRHLFARNNNGDSLADSYADKDVPFDPATTLDSSVADARGVAVGDPLVETGVATYAKVKPNVAGGGEEPTQLKHLVFGIVGSENAWHQRKYYIESWWRPNQTRGLLFLEKEPTGDLLPWSRDSPPYRISANLTKLLNKTDVTPQRIANGIRETFKEMHEGMRWLIMGDDDSILFLDNLVELLQKYDHNKYYYIGTRSEFVLSNFLFSFSQGFGGAGAAISYPLAKALARDMDSCLLKYHYFIAADQTAMSCIADLGSSLTEHQGFHQMDLRGDVSGLLSSHPNVPLISLHHFDMVDPIFPTMDRYESTRHLMKAAKVDPQRMLQQTVCYYRKWNWTFSISWGYSVYIYEKMMARSILQYPIESFRTWLPGPGPPFYMFNTRLPSSEPCDAPHMFFFQAVERTKNSNVTDSIYGRAWPRRLPICGIPGSRSADFIIKIRVFSPASRRKRIDRAECCDVIEFEGNRAKIKLRECKIDEKLI